LASAAVAAEGLTLRGVQSYSGNLQHIPVRAERRAKALAQLDRLRCMIARLRDGGLEVPIVTGAGTGTFDLDPEARVFTELQVGSYVFMDVDYLRAMREGRNAPPFETALFVATAVVSTNARDYVQQMVISPVHSSRSWVAYRRELYFLLRLQCGSCMTQLAFQSPVPAIC
jgi:D-serine deaminase-like pyridoxal phosphate-dependent protein